MQTYLLSWWNTGSCNFVLCIIPKQQLDEQATFNVNAVLRVFVAGYLVHINVNNVTTYMYVR